LFAINRSAWFTGYEIFAHGILAVLGVVLVVAVTRGAGRENAGGNRE
jgi:hypothetical protein